jgi:RNA polymerase sigma-70 factor, ECF subfamily
MHSLDSPFARPQAAAALDAELGEGIRDCARHSLPALRRIYELIAPRMLAELLQMLGDPAEAQAALVDCFIAIWNSAGSFNPQRSTPRAWLLSIARHHAMDLVRETLAETPEEVDNALCFLHEALQAEGVPPAERSLHLAWRSGRSSAEIARALQWPLRRVQHEIRQGLALMAASFPEKPQDRARDHAAAAYALGILTSRARRRFAALLRRDIAVRRAWQQWEERLSALTPDIPPVRPAGSVWPAIEKRIQPQAPARPGSQLRWLLAAVVMAAIAFAMVWRKIRS